VLEEAYLQSQGMQLANPPIESVFPSSPFPFRYPHSGFNGLVGSQEHSVQTSKALDRESLLSWIEMAEHI